MDLAGSLVVLVVLALLLVRHAVIGRVARVRHSRRAHDFAHRMGVPLTAELEAELAGRLRRRRTCELVGIVLAVAVGIGSVGVLVSWLAGHAVGRCVAQALEARRAVAGGARVTHLLVPRLADYVSPLSVLCVHLIALMPVVLGLLWFTAPARADVAQQGPAAYWPALDWVVAATMAVPLAALLVADLGGWLVLRLRRVAGTPAELALDDAFRVTTLRDLGVLPVLAGVSGASTMGSALNHVLPAGPLAWLGSPMPSVLALGLALLAAGIETATFLRWRRLHPQLAPQ